MLLRCWWGGVGWGGMLTFLVLRAWYICHAAEIFGIVYYVTCADGVGWGGVGGHFNVPCTSYMIYCHAAEISGIVYYVTCCYVAEISGIVYYVICCYAAEICGIVYYVTCCYAAEISGIVYLRYMFYVESDGKSQFPATWVPKVTSWWCMLELGNGDAFTRMLTASW